MEIKQQQQFQKDYSTTEMQPVQLKQSPIYIDPLLKLIRILEDLFFTMSVSEDIASKYNLLKEQYYSEVNQMLVPHFSTIKCELISIDKYPNIRRVGEKPAKQIQHEDYPEYRRDINHLQKSQDKIKTTLRSSEGLSLSQYTQALIIEDLEQFQPESTFNPSNQITNPSQSKLSVRFDLPEPPSSTNESLFVINSLTQSRQQPEHQASTTDQNFIKIYDSNNNYASATPNNQSFSRFQEVQLTELMRMSSNIEKLLEYMPIEEGDSAQVLQNYLDEFKWFMHERQIRKAKRETEQTLKITELLKHNQQLLSQLSDSKLQKHMQI